MMSDVETGLFPTLPVSCCWENAQFVATGNGPQLKVTVPVKPLMGVIVIVAVPGWPREIVMDGGAVKR